MKTVGIIGGIGPDSTIEYYRSIIDLYQERKKDGSFPSIIINSIDLQKIVALIVANELETVTHFLCEELGRLVSAGATFGLLAANTPHVVFDQVNRDSKIPLISIVQATCDAAKTLGLKRLGLFGTRFTMQGRFYPDVFSKDTITLILPNEKEQSDIHEIYMNELLKGLFLPETRERLLKIAERLKNEERIEGLILGGTELPLILRDADSLGIPLLDTTQIHVSAIVTELLS